MIGGVRDLSRKRILGVFGLNHLHGEFVFGPRRQFEYYQIHAMDDGLDHTRLACRTGR